MYTWQFYDISCIVFHSKQFLYSYLADRTVASVIGTFQRSKLTVSRIYLIYILHINLWVCVFNLVRNIFELHLSMLKNTFRNMEQWITKINSYVPDIVFSRLVSLSLYKHSWIRSWNHPVLNNQCKVSCSRKQRVVPDRVWTHAASDP